MYFAPYRFPDAPRRLEHYNFPVNTAVPRKSSKLSPASTAQALLGRGQKSVQLGIRIVKSTPPETIRKRKTPTYQNALTL